MPDRLAAEAMKQEGFCPVTLARDSIHAKLTNWYQAYGGPFVLALSGGGDSMALCRIAGQWAHAHGVHLHAVSVDHGLRPTSAAEATQAISWAQACGLTGEVIGLAQKPARGGLQAWARQARYEALATAAQRIGAKLILVGHTYDDQLETICWRLARQTGLDGLAGMAELAINAYGPLTAKTLLGRPLLSLKRADLREWLIRQGQAWLDDESNENQDFARIRTRKHLALMARQGVDIDRLIRIASHADHLRAAQEEAAFTLLEGCDLQALPGGWRVAANILDGPNPLVQERALSWLIYSLTLAEHPPGADKVARLRHSLKADPQRKTTLSGVAVQQRAGWVIFQRAPPRRGQERLPVLTPTDQYARLFSASRQPHKFVTQ